MNVVAQVCVNISIGKLDKKFSYIVPPCFNISSGWRVLVPFGNRIIDGFVVETFVQEDVNGLKEIIDIIDDSAWFDENMLATAKWISNYYLCTLAEAMRLFIPGTSSIRIEKSYRINEDQINTDNHEYNSVEKSIIKYLQQRKKITSQQVIKKFGKESITVLADLIERGIVILDTGIVKTDRNRYEKAVKLLPEKNNNYDEQQFAGKPAQLRLVKMLQRQGSSLSYRELSRLKIGKDTVKRLVDKGIVEIVNIPIIRDSYRNYDYTQIPVTLTAEQAQVLEKIKESIQDNKYKSFLLHGITGSGKTQVYIEAVAEVRKAGRQAIVLVPEIALTSQIVQRFKARFGDDVVVIHSKLSRGERFDSLQRLKRQQAHIVIGARSAIFAPVNDLGIVILDEEHEASYKQEEHPRYHTRNVAAARANFSRGIVILGSATPSIETYYCTKSSNKTLLTLDSRISEAKLPSVSIVDMREELKQGRRNVLSLQLKELLLSTLEQGEQAILLLNRRGFSTFVLCRECGHVIKCPHCSVSLVYHDSEHVLRCHYCHRSFSVPDICPACKSRYIRYFGTGTQKVEMELKKCFPQARIVRMDQDTTTQKFAYDRILSEFSKRKYDILLGTQMVAKGHDIANVTAVGIITADTGLNLPDFRSAERVFALLTQAAGRAGRSNKSGKVIIQTYNPEHYAIMAATKQDYHSFYEQEVIYRQELEYPPFSKLAKITVIGSDAHTAVAHAEHITNLLQQAISNDICSIMMYASAVSKVNDTYRMNILIKSNHMDEVKQAIKNIVNAVKTHISLDIDPISVM